MDVKSSIIDTYDSSYYPLLDDDTINKIYDKMEESSEIGMIKQDKERILNYMKIVTMFSLIKESPKYTGNLAFNGINIKEKGKLSADIIIRAPGQVDKKGRKLPDYGWQTDMLDRLQFYTVDGEFIDVENRHKGWVDDAIEDASYKIADRFEGLVTEVL
jgi:hypothetical protein